jgi:[ribosomal protein S5]-alanine N-acetyltransferase
MTFLLDNQETKRLLFRRLLPSDFETWVEFMKDPSSTEFIPMPDNSSPVEKCKVWFDKIFYRYENNKGGLNVLIDKLTGDFIGQCGLLVHIVDDVEELEIAYSIMPQYHGQGFATEAAKKCRDFAFENNYRDSLISLINDKNTFSKKVAFNLGMTLDKVTTYNSKEFNVYRIMKDKSL